MGVLKDILHGSEIEAYPANQLNAFLVLNEEAIPRVYIEDLDVWKIKPSCKFPAILIKDSIVNSEDP